MRTLTLLTIFCGYAFGQTAASVAPNINPQFFDASTGVALPCNGCKLYSYQAGTLSPFATYTDYTGTVTNSDPITLDSAGYTPSGIWIKTQCYKFILKTSALVTIWTRDQVCDNAQLLKVNYAASTGASLVGFQQTGSSTLVSTVRAKLYQFPTLVDYAGVDPTGISDSSTGVQNAINDAVAASYGLIICTPGTYNLGSTGLTAINGFTIFAPKGGCIFKYAGSDWVFTLGIAGTATYHYKLEGIGIVITSDTGNGIKQLSTHDVNITDVEVQGNTAGSAGATNICHVIDGVTSDSIFTQTTNLYCLHTLIGQRHLSTGGFNNTTTVNNTGFKAFGDLRAGSIGVDIQDGNGDGSTWTGGNIEDEALGINLFGGLGVGAHRAAFNNVRFESNTVDVLIGAGANSNTFQGNQHMSTITDNTSAAIKALNQATMFINNAPDTCCTSSQFNLVNGTMKLYGDLNMTATGSAPVWAPVIPNASTQPILSPALANGTIPFRFASTGMLDHFGSLDSTWGPASGVSDPNSVVAACIGSLVTAPSGVGSLMAWIKETGACTNTGWHAIPTYSPATGFTVIEGQMYIPGTHSTTGDRYLCVDSNGGVTAKTSCTGT